MKYLCLILITFSLLKFSYAQYNVSVSNDTYTALSSADTLEEIISFQIYISNIYGEIPIGFDYEINGLVYTTISLAENGFAVFKGTDPQFSISIFDCPLQNFSGDPTNSPILYTTEGIVGNRIFKCEYQHVGFAEDLDDDDYVSFQLWLYESCNQFEIRIGDHQINSNVFFNSYPAPYMGFASYITSQVDQMLSGSVSNPTLSQSTATLNSLPLPNSVYTFDDCSLGTDELDHSFTVYPTLFTNKVFINSTNTGDEISVELTDLNGNSVYYIEHFEGTELHLEHLASGTYFLKLTQTSSGEFSAHKLIKV